MNSSKRYIRNLVQSKRLLLVVFLLGLGFVFTSNAQNGRSDNRNQVQADPLGDKAVVSLLTVSPGEEVYAQYGHTAIRISDPQKGYDIVFNYGLFDFNSSHFIWRFVKGETDYVVGPCAYSDFVIEYQMANRAVTEQILRLNQEEKEAIWQALVENIQPENRVYRYNFIYNNCATKPRDILIKNIRGQVDYHWSGRFKSLREEIHFFTRNFPWTQFGIDLVLGVQADDSASLSAQQFAPDLLMESFAKASIVRGSDPKSPLVLQTTQPVTIEPSLVEKSGWRPGPTLVMWMVFLMTVVFSFLEIKKKKTFSWVNGLLFAAMGLVGTIIAFLVLFSEHPTTDVNYLLLWLHPLHLVYAVALIFPVFRKKYDKLYLSLNLPFQVLALMGTFFLSQYYHPAFYPMLFTLLLRSGLAVYSLQKKKSHA